MWLSTAMMWIVYYEAENENVYIEMLSDFRTKWNQAFEDYYISYRHFKHWKMESKYLPSI